MIRRYLPLFFVLYLTLFAAAAGAQPPTTAPEPEAPGAFAQFMLDLVGSPAGLGLVTLALTSLFASLANALIPNEGENAGPLKVLAGKLLRAFALAVGEAIPKKHQP